ncbi:MAG: SET domain-containing protein-lysine N-methyltransferase [Candidatus Staskawiczbacteria bacterium]|jgi:hypothetical protein
MDIFPPKKIKVVNIAGKGRGVVATEDIKSGEIIEVCPIVFLSEKEVSFLEKESGVLKFYYLIQTATNKFCIMLGYGSLYNHSFEPNADIDYDTSNPKDHLFVEAIKDIKKGEEIVYDYEFDDNITKFLEQK